jgi:hypothetical protein
MSPRESIRSAGSTTGGAAQDCCGRLDGWLGSDSAAEINEIVGDDPEPHPALHSIVARISAPVEAMSTLAHADGPSHPVRHRWPLRNQRFFCLRLRSALLAE